MSVLTSAKTGLDIVNKQLITHLNSGEGFKGRRTTVSFGSTYSRKQLILYREPLIIFPIIYNRDLLVYFLFCIFS